MLNSTSAFKAQKQFSLSIDTHYNQNPCFNVLVQPTNISIYIHTFDMIYT